MGVIRNWMGTRAVILGTSFVAVLLGPTPPAHANNVYYDFTLPTGMADSLQMLLYVTPYGALVPPELPSAHEALVYRAIGLACGPTGDSSECLLYKTQWDDCLSGSCHTYSTCGEASSPAANACQTIGQGGYVNWDFRSLLIGARFVDMREMSGPEAENMGVGPVFEAMLGIKPWDNALGQAGQFPTQHAYGVSRLLQELPTAVADAREYYKVQWWNTPCERSNSIAGLAERNQVVLTATAAFLVDRFFQAQAEVIPGSLLPVTDFSNLDQTLDEHWRVGVLIAGLSTIVDSPAVTAALEAFALAPLDPLTSPGAAAALVAAILGEALSDAPTWSEMWTIAANPALDRERAEIALASALASQLVTNPVQVLIDNGQWSLAARILADDDPGEHLEVRPDLFYIGQGAHAIADSFAHTVREFRNVVEFGTSDARMAVGAIRSDAGDPKTPWFYVHSGAADNNGDFMYLGGPLCYDHVGWRGVDTGSCPGEAVPVGGAGDDLFFHPSSNPLGRANTMYAPAAVREWFAIFATPSSLPPWERYRQQFAALRRFIKRNLAYALPQELSLGEVWKYQPIDRCESDVDCIAAFDDGTAPSDGTCDVASGLCRRICIGPVEGADPALLCNPGFTCSSGIGYDGAPTPRFCFALWDPWESVADEYMVRLQRNDGDWAGKKWLPPSSTANEWYMLERNVEPVADADTWGFDRVELARSTFRGYAGESEELVAIAFDGLSYTGAAYPIYSGRGSDGIVNVGDTLPHTAYLFPDNEIESIYVEPRKRVCLVNDEGRRLCLYGGLNGSAEGRLMRVWRNRVSALAWNELDIDHDDVPDYRDNCLLTMNSSQADFDGDGYGDLCDRDADGDLVLDDSNGYFGFADGQRNPCRIAGSASEDAATWRAGERCDDNCLLAYNPAKKDLGPGAVGDGIDDQFDLDGDGLGDSCDDDPDGDERGLDYATGPAEYDEPGGQPAPAIAPPTRQPFTECADYLWFLSVDNDNDDVCDMYNFIGYANAISPWMPDHAFDGLPIPGVSYLKPYWQEARVDIQNSHYLGIYYHEGCPTSRAHVAPPPDVDATECPGESGYTWAQEVARGDGMSWFGYEGCMRNLVDVWHYYQLDDSRTSLALDEASVLEVGFEQGRDGVVDRELDAGTFALWTPPGFDRSGQRTEDADAWKAMAELLAFKKEAFRLSLNPELCRVDNCARFMRMNGPSDVHPDDIDPLSRRIMDFDGNPPLEVGMAKTMLCWTPNEQSAPFNAQLFCDFCSAFYADGNPVPDSCSPDESEEANALGYTAWYHNPDQQDSNRDGVGDKCTEGVDIASLAQAPVARRKWGGTYGSESAWLACVGSTGCMAFDADDTNPTDRGTGLPIRTADDWLIAPTRSELEGLCQGLGCAFGVGCMVKEYQVWPRQELRFTNAGWSEGRVGTTLGACACYVWDLPNCYGEGMRCWRPSEDLWRDNPDAYYGLSGEMVRTEYDADRSGRPRYDGFRRFGNRRPELYSLTITEPCQPTTRTCISTPGGVPLCFDVGWDENPFPVPGVDGCQEIGMTFHWGQRRSLEWGYAGQIEPDPRSVPAGFFSGSMRNGEQLWMEGNTTALRVGVMPVSVGGVKYWQRQWHTPVYPSPTEGVGGDPDRPMPEAGFGTGRDGEVGLVYFVPECSGSFGRPDDYWVAGPDDWWEEERDSTAGSPEEVAGVAARVAGSGRAAVILDSAELMVGSGDVVPNTKTFELTEPGFPATDFAIVRLSLGPRSATMLFGHPGDGSPTTVDLVVGGRDASGQVLADVWVSRSWEAVPRFQRLTGAPKPPASIEDAVKPPPDGGGFAVAEPRVVADLHRRRLLVLGGMAAAGTPLNRIYSFDLVTRTWAPVGDEMSTFTPTPTQASLGALAADPARRRAFLVATGPDAVRVFQVDLEPSVPIVREIVSTGAGPAPRGGAAVAYSAGTDRILLFGGERAMQIGEVPSSADDPAAMALPPPGALAFLGDTWSFDPHGGTWTLLRADGGPGIARADSWLVAGLEQDAYVVGGRDETGRLPTDRALRLDLNRPEDQKWRTADAAEGRLLRVDGHPHAGFWRPGDPPFYTLIGHGLQIDLAKPAQLVLEADPTLLSVLALSGTSRQTVSGQVGTDNGIATLPLFPGEQYFVAIQGRSTVVPKTGVPFTLRAVSATPQGRHWNIDVPRQTRFDAMANEVYVANWDTLDIYQWNGAVLTKVAALPMQAAVDVTVANGIAYVADFEQGLVTVDVGNAAEPAVLDTEWVLGTPDSVAVQGNKVFLGTGIFGVSQVDAANPSDLTWVKQITLGNQPPAAVAESMESSAHGTVGADAAVVDVSVAGNYLLIGDSNRTTWIYGLVADEDAVLAGSYSGLLAVEDTAVHGSTLYVSDGQETIEVVDIRDTTAPVRVTLSHGPEWEVSTRFGGDMIVERTVRGGIAVLQMREVMPDSDDDGGCDHGDGGEDDDDHGGGGHGDDGDHHGGGDHEGDEEHHGGGGHDDGEHGGGPGGGGGHDGEHGGGPSGGGGGRGDSGRGGDDRGGGGGRGGR